MKKMLLFFLGFLVFNIADAQYDRGLKGPQAKNTIRGYSGSKAWAVTQATPLNLKGPAAKNYHRKGVVAGRHYTPVTLSPRMWRKGPGAKNYQPQIQKSNQNIFRHSSSDE